LGASTCGRSQIWYAVAKTEAEEMALEYGEKKGLNVVTLLPGLVVGPVLQTERLNISIRLFQYVITGSFLPKAYSALVHRH
jgi:nucleoside-diphosphate-sugar epimerase